VTSVRNEERLAALRLRRLHRLATQRLVDIRDRNFAPSRAKAIAPARPMPSPPPPTKATLPSIRFT
jgi:hypothetical protein